MTGYNSQVGRGEYLIQFYTDDRRLYELTQDIIRLVMDKERFVNYVRDSDRYIEQGRYSR
jgi:predicted oxidoreductase (fatty acid repression mutant protein)